MQPANKKAWDGIPECPLPGRTERPRQEYFIRCLGNNVNLANIRPDDIIPLEGLRRGLRGGTFRIAVYEREQSRASRGL